MILPIAAIVGTIIALLVTPTQERTNKSRKKEIKGILMVYPKITMV
ncbi:hypothetical protein GF325_10610 [Candidatus Bathyarchaeota archaeon]|nr:hypothetical protein [Candidatus Bathyarchaeota archaeon]